MHIKQLLPAFMAAAVLAGCSPTYNWRDYTSSDGGFRVLFPAKPATHTRGVDLGGIKVDMTMTAAEVDGTTFAVGTAVAPDAALAQATLPGMRQALLRNIGASDQEAVSEGAGNGGTGNKEAGGNAAAGSTTLDVDAVGKGNSGPVRLVGRFLTKGTRMYQVIVVGKPGAMPPEHTEQFLASFKPQ